ncbi:MAG: GGDEF domain-containing protein [Burkholderiaceae bacterium]
MASSRSRIPKIATALAIVAAIVAVVALDAVTGMQIQVLSLYFVPLALAGWQLGRAGAVATALLATVAWMVARTFGGEEDWSVVVWLINFLTQSTAFLTVGLLVAEVTRRLAAERALSRHDMLTGLRNRRAMTEDAEVALQLCRRHARAVSVAFIDLDGFKRVNDMKGHDRGDDVLRTCAAVIRASVRASDIAARLGGDEFIVLLPETGGADAVALMERLRARIEATPALREAGVTATIGVFSEGRAVSDIAALVAQADAVMYDAKAAGKNRVVGRDLGTS